MAGVADDGAVLRRQDAVIRRVRVAAALLALAQFLLYEPPPGLGLPWPQLLMGLLVGGILLAISGISWLATRGESPSALRRSGRVQLVADSAVVVAVMIAFAFDPTALVWSLTVLPVVEGALRFGLRGAMGTWGALTLAYVAVELWAVRAYEHVTLRLDALTYVVGLVAVVAFAMGAVVRHLDERTEQFREAERRMAAMVYIDALTRLPNRARLLGTLDRFDGQDAGYAVAFIDLDDFKQVNDRHGHEAGDEVLRTVANRLEESVRPTDLVARLAGDEFVVVLPGLDEPDAVAAAVGRMAAASRATAVAGTVTIPVAASVGVAVGHGTAVSGREVLQAADAAMYEAKAASSSEPVVVDATRQPPVPFSRDGVGRRRPLNRGAAGSGAPDRRRPGRPSPR